MNSSKIVGFSLLALVGLSPSFAFAGSDDPSAKDDVQLSFILSLSHLSTQGVSSNFVSGLIEPSLHIPFSETVFGMLGAGIGPSWADGPGLGLAFAPRIGIQFLLGRSGILTPSF